MECWYFRLKGTVILKIWWQILLVMIYTSVIVCFHKYVPELRMQFTQTLIPILGVVTGLLLVFRTNTAYDRYWEGRRLWSQMTVGIRTLTRGIWTGVLEPEAKDVVEKKSVLNILVAFAISTKHYLREEYAYDYEDLKDLIIHLPKYATPSSTKPLIEQQKLDQTFLRLNAHDIETPSNIPIELSYYVAAYLTSVNRRKLIDTALLTPLQNALTSIVECLTSFERIMRTPIPMAYSVHLYHSIWLYLLALPYQLVNPLNWWTVPAVSLAAFSLLGMLAIGSEIENPFGYDDNDLPLDDFCKVIRREVRMIIGNRQPTTDVWVFSTENRPIVPTCDLTALQLSAKTVDEVHHLLFLNAQHALNEHVQVLVVENNHSRNSKNEKEPENNFQTLVKEK